MAFEIDAEGRYIFWPQQDIHMGWSQFQQAADPVAKLRAMQRSEAFNARYGRAIRAIREQDGLKQSEIPGLSARTVRRIELGQTRATATALEKLAAAHAASGADYLARLADRLRSESSGEA